MKPDARAQFRSRGIGRVAARSFSTARLSTMRGLRKRAWFFGTALLAVCLAVVLHDEAESAVAAKRSKVAKLHPAVQPAKLDIDPANGDKTLLADFATAPFPYDGRSSSGLLNVTAGKRKGHRNDATYRDDRVLLHIPRQFNINRPGVMVVFFHGHRATLSRDVRDRQKVPAQVSASGINAVLVAPQFAVNAADSSAGKFWEPGAFNRFVGEAAQKLGKLYDDPGAGQAFANMPIVIVAYSGGYHAAASCLKVGGVDGRLKGVVLLDALYGDLDKFATWITKNKSRFFVSSYTGSTRQRNYALKAMLDHKNVAVEMSLQSSRWEHSVTFLPTNSKINHTNFVTRAWTNYPIADLLSKLEEYRP